MKNLTNKQVYEKTRQLFNNECAICGNNQIAMHHIRFGGLQGGRKTYMGNVIPLCEYHHRLVHSNKKKYQPMLIKIINDRIDKYEKL